MADGFVNPLQGIQQTLQQLAIQAQSPQAKALELRIEEREQERVRGNLLTNFLSKADLNQFKPSDILATVASITGDQRLVPNLIQQRFKEGVLAKEADRFRALAPIVGQVASGEISVGEAAQSVLAGGGKLDEVGQVAKLAPTSESGVRTLSAQEVQRLGFQPGSVVQRAPDGTLKVVRDAGKVKGAKAESSLGLFRELTDQVTREERTPESASELFFQKTGERLTFTPGLARGEEKSLERIAAETEVRTQAALKVKTKAILRDVKSINKDLNAVLGLFDKIPTELKGPLAGRTLGQAAKFVKGSAELTAFEDFKQFILSNISRQLGGERGVLTDRDVERIGAALPNLQDTRKSSALKIKQIRDFVQRRLRVKQAIIDEPVAQQAQAPDLNDQAVIQDAQTELDNRTQTTPEITADAIKAHIAKIKGQ